MKDRGIPVRKNIRKIIIKSLIVLFVVIGVSLVAAGYFLKQGIHLTHFGLGPVTISNCSLVWKQKLELQIDSIEFSEVEKTSSSKTDLKTVKRSLYTAQKFARLFSFASIADLSVGGRNIAVKLTQITNREYLLSLQTEHIDFTSRLTFKTDSLVADIVEFDMQRFNSTATGQIRLEADSDQLTGTISALINEDFPVTVDFVGDGEQLSFAGMEAGPIFEIAPLVDLFGLSHNIQRGITDYLSGSRYHLNYFKGNFPWADPAVLLDTLEAEVRVDDTEYTFAQGLEPVKAKFTDAVFSNGVLVITPRESTFYGQDVGNSGLDIDFNDPTNIILSAYIKTSAVANDDILLMLDYYNISLPFKQVGGTTKTDLELTINLNKTLVEARGGFEITDAAVEYNEGEYRVANARILFENSDVTIDHLEVGFEDLWHAYISGKIFVRKGVGDLNITLKQFNMPLNDSGEFRFQLDQSRPSPTFHYRIRPEGHTVESSFSNWLMSEIEVEVAPFSTPFYLDDLSVRLDGVQVKTVPGGTVIVSGPASIKKKTADLKCILRQFQNEGLLLEGEELVFHVTLGDGIVVKSKNQSQWSLNTVPANLSPLELGYRQNVLSLTTTRLHYGELLDTLVSGSYNTVSRDGEFSFEKVSLMNRKLDKELGFEEGFVVQLTGDKQDFIAKIPDLGFVISRDIDNNWSANLNDLALIHRHSTTLKKYNISEGSIHVSFANGQEPFTYTAEITDPYLILIDDSGPVDKLTISGEAGSKGLSALINDKLHIEYADSRLQAHTERLGLNIPAIISLIEDHSDSSSTSPLEKDSKSIEFSLIAEDSHLLFSPNSRLLADHVLLKLSGNTVTMDLNHGPGSIELKADGKQFTLQGNGLNNEFMSGLIGGSRFEKGVMAVAAQGTFDQFSVIFELKNSVLKHLKTVNNIMAFINTVPALTTFSLPGYSTSGLVVRYVVVGMAFNGKNATIESIEVDSSQMNVVGVGSMDFSEQLINLDLKLISQAKSNLGKIPVVGYIVGGEKEKRFKAISISGPFNDPVVKHSLQRDFIAQPVKMLARILSLPFYLVKKIAQSSEERRKIQTVEQFSAPVATESE